MFPVFFRHTEKIYLTFIDTCILGGIDNFQIHSRERSVSYVTTHRYEPKKRGSIPGRGKDFSLHLHISRTAVGPNQPLFSGYREFYLHGKVD